MLRAVFNLFKLWQVNDGQAKILLGEPSSSTFYRWKRGEIGAIPRDTVRRLGDLMGIHKALRYMFVEPERSYAWISKPNVAFGGRSASAEAKTNPRVRDQVGDLSLVPVERRLVGPTASLGDVGVHPSFARSVRIFGRLLWRLVLRRSIRALYRGAGRPGGVNTQKRTRA